MKLKKNNPGFSTRAIHVGQEPDPLTGAVSVPIYPTSPYVQQEIGKNKGYEYARVSNPTRDRLEQNLAALEGGIGAKVFASGMAAINAIATMFKAGDHVVCGHNLYGGTPRLFNQVLATFGMQFSYVDTADVKNVERAIRKNTRMVFVETPTNPLMALSDLRAIGCSFTAISGPAFGSAICTNLAVRRRSPRQLRSCAIRRIWSSFQSALPRARFSS